MLLGVEFHHLHQELPQRGVPDITELTGQHAQLGGVLLFLISGALVIEQVFTWPGIGQFTYQSVIGKDYPVVMAGVMISSLLLVVSYLLRDIVYVFVDPRVTIG